MRRFLTLVCLLCVAIPAGISISGCTRNPAGQYCPATSGYGLKLSDVASIFLTPQTTGISLAFGQTVQLAPPTAKTCVGAAATVSAYSYGTTNNQLVDVSPSGQLCAGTWNRNTGGGIPNYTICNKPDPLPSTGNLPYATAYVSASANTVTSNPVAVYVHAQVTSVNLVTVPVSGGTQQQCYSQNQVAQLDAQACFAGSNNQQQLLCAPSSVTSAATPNLACPLPPGVSISSIPRCTVPLGTLSYTVVSNTIASINAETNQITANLPGTTVITASIAQGASTAGYFSTCPPASISVSLANGATSGTITKGVQQNLTTSAIDTYGMPLVGLTLDYQSTDPIDISVGSTGNVSASFPGSASVYAICQPPSCNTAPVNVIGLYGTGLPVSSNPVQITTPGTASNFLWFSSPGQSQYFGSLDLLTGGLGANVRLPYVPNSMVMDRTGLNLYFGSQHQLMIYNTASNTLAHQDSNVPGVVLAVAPNNSEVLINDPVRQVFYVYNASAYIITSSFAGMGSAAAWTPDAKTLYITDSAALGAGHSDKLYVYSGSTGWSSYPLASSEGQKGAQNLAIAVPSVGAFLSGSTTVAHTWCPSGIVGDTASMIFYPQGAPGGPTENSVSTQTDVLAATTDGKHILGASTTGTPSAGASITLSDIGVDVPSFNCLPQQADPNYPLVLGDTLSPLDLTTVLSTTQPTVPATAAQVNEVVVAPSSALAFITYQPPTTGAATGVGLPYYIPGPYNPQQPSTPFAAGTVGSVTLGGSAASSITAPVAGVFTPDDSLFFVSTAGDNLLHAISIPTTVTPASQLIDTQQIAPNLPSCVSGGNDLGCTYTGSGAIVPATVITAKPRTTT